MVALRAPAVALLVAWGCAAPRPADRALAESVGITLVACLPANTSATASPVVSGIEAQLVVGGDVTVGDIVLDRAALTCVHGAGADCDSARACLGVELRAVTACGLELPHCSIGHLVYCSEGHPLLSAFRTAIDCAATDRVCVQNGELTATCADGLCPIGERTFTCSDATTVETCTDGALVHRRCPPGWICDAERGDCVGGGSACVADVCMGDVRVPCDGDRTTAPEDCAATGRRCDSFSPSGAVCTPIGVAECDPRVSFEDHCEGDELVYCGIEGRFRRYDCVAHGYLGCLVDGATCVAASPAL